MVSKAEQRPRSVMRSLQSSTWGSLLQPALKARDFGAYLPSVVLFHDGRDEREGFTVMTTKPILENFEVSLGFCN